MSDVPGAVPVEDEESSLGEIEEDVEGEDAADDDGGDSEADAGDDGGAEDDAPEGQAGGVAPRESRRARLARENRELREQLAEARGARSVLERQPPPQQPVYDPQAQARADAALLEQLQQMDPAQALIHVRNLEQQRFGQALGQVRAETQDAIARSRFEDRMERNSTYKQYGPRVIEAVQQARAQGNYALTYEAAFRYMVGDEMVQKAERAAPAQARRGAARVARQTVRAPSGRGDVTGGGRRPVPGSREADEAAIRDADARGIKIW